MIWILLAPVVSVALCSLIYGFLRIFTSPEYDVGKRNRRIRGRNVL